MRSHRLKLAERHIYGIGARSLAGVDTASSGAADVTVARAGECCCVGACRTLVGVIEVLAMPLRCGLELGCSENLKASIEESLGRDADVGVLACDRSVDRSIDVHGLNRPVNTHHEAYSSCYTCIKAAERSL